ncbi:MAG: hypothetical protein AB7F49_35035, partial [Pseudorhodoplanes sp.]
MTKKRSRRHKRGSDAEDLDQLLLDKYGSGEGSSRPRMTALDWILEQLWLKESAGEPRALEVRLRYEKAFRNDREPRPQLIFEDSDYTRSLFPNSEEDS